LQALSSGAIMIGIPVVFGMAVGAYRDAKDRGYALAAIVVCSLAAIYFVARLFSF